MSDSIQQKGDDVAIVIYDAPLPPKYFRLTKRFIKTLFIVVPVLLVIIFSSLFLWGLAIKAKDTPTPTIPSPLNEQENKVYSLENELKNLKLSNEQLVEKLSTTPSAIGTEDPYLMAIRKPYGMQNLSSENRVSLDQLQLIEENQKTTLKFQILSSNPETRVVGHVLVFMLSEAGLMLYPKAANTLLSQGVKFSEGEPFSISRLRTTNAEFHHKLTGSSVKFVIYIFNREGDLLLIKETEPFKVSTK